MSKAKSLAVVLVFSIFPAATGHAGRLEAYRAAAGKDLAAFAAAGDARLVIPAGRMLLNDPLPALSEAVPPAPGAVELFCSDGRLTLTLNDGAGYNATIDDAKMTRSLRELAAKLPGGERSLVNVTFKDRSFVVADLRKVPGTVNYDAGQSGPRLNMLSGGRASLLLTYSGAASARSNEYRELVSLGFSGCVK